ncbi:MAG: hydantoinase/oxoprolinase family protein [Thioalkalivibrio sp.]
MRDQATLGWDLGGAHVKVARIDAEGRLENAIKLACPLWQGMEHLEFAISRALDVLGHGTVHHAVTMTGELVDLFPGRSEGVRRILHTLTGMLGRSSVQVYAGYLGLITPTEALDCPDAVSSSNWHASAAWLAMHCSDALLIDVGSTTTDLIAVREGRVSTRGVSDCQRLKYQELIYTGVSRTPVMALARTAPVDGAWVGIMAEHFATTADVHRLTGMLDERVDLFPAADNGPKTQEGSARRLARMVGMDLQHAPQSTWHSLAEYFASCQVQSLEVACRLQLSQSLWADLPVLVGAGSGSFIANCLAQRLGLSYQSFPGAVGLQVPADATVLDCIPALAVAQLSGGLHERVARSA